VLIAAKDTVNWLTGVQDEFSEKAKTAPLTALAAVGEPIGIGHLRRWRPYGLVTSVVMVGVRRERPEAAEHRAEHRVRTRRGPSTGCW
jgi:hypothetical protein